MLAAAGVATAVMAGAVSTATAATLTFSLTTTQGSASSDTDVVLTDIAGGVQFGYTVNDPTNTADIAAVYFNIVGGSFPAGIAVQSSPVVNSYEFDTDHIRNGNIGQEFDIGIAIGLSGSGSDFYSSFMFSILGTGLDVTDFLGQTFAVRGQTVRPPTSTGGGSSSKEFGTAPTQVDLIPPVPLPAALPLLLVALGGLGFAARRRKAA